MLESSSSRQTRSNRVSISLTPDLYARLQTLAVRDGRSLSNLCVHLIASAISQHETAD